MKFRLAFILLLIPFLLQYNTPGNPADYVHRVGRTARIGLKGHALLFLTPAEVSFVDYCNCYDGFQKKVLNSSLQFGSCIFVIY